jgi:hypothetical protein
MLCGRNWFKKDMAAFPKRLTAMKSCVIFFLRAEIERCRVFQAKFKKDHSATTPLDQLFSGIMDNTLSLLP